MSADTRIVFEKVIAWLESNSGIAPNLDELAAVAGLSRHHFHRQFSTTFGISLQTLMRRVRTHRAAWQLAYRHSMSITDIGCEAGYENSESFSRAFKRQTGVTPSEFRHSPDLERITQLANSVRVLDSETPDNTATDASAPALVQFEGVKLAQLLHMGSPQTLMASVGAFIQWRKLNGSPPSQSRTFNIFYSDPSTTEPEAFTFGIAAEHNKGIAPYPQGVTEAHIPALHCLSWIETGTDGKLQQRIEQVIGEGGYDWDFEQFPPFIERLRFYPDVPMAEAKSRVYLPVRSLLF